MSIATMTGAATAPTQLIHAKKATYAYRRFGHGAARRVRVAVRPVLSPTPNFRRRNAMTPRDRQRW